MMPVGHGMLSNFLATFFPILRLRGLVRFGLLVLFSHILLDVAPHAEPSMFGLVLWNDGYAGLIWTGTEVTAAVLMSWYLRQHRPEYTAAIAIGLIIALGVDVVQQYYNHSAVSWLVTYDWLHEGLHWWKYHLPHQVAVVWGVLDTVLLYVSGAVWTFRCARSPRSTSVQISAVA